MELIIAASPTGRKSGFKSSPTGRKSGFKSKSPETKVNPKVKPGDGYRNKDYSYDEANSTDLNARTINKELGQSRASKIIFESGLSLNGYTENKRKGELVFNFGSVDGDWAWDVKSGVFQNIDGKKYRSAGRNTKDFLAFLSKHDFN